MPRADRAVIRLPRVSLGVLVLVGSAASLASLTGCSQSPAQGTTPDLGGATVDGSLVDSDTPGGPTPDLARPADPPIPTGDNVAPLVIDQGPAGGSVDVPFISVTLCVPGTTDCQTIDHVSVDTGSSGLRIVSSVLKKSLMFPQPNAANGDPLAECFQFADGYTFGSVRLADVKIAGLVAPSARFQAIGDPAYPGVPGDCSSSGPSENTVAAFGANGLIGINQIVADCGSFCADTQNPGTGAYYSCVGRTCATAAVAEADQVRNPIAAFATDNNGAFLELPSVPSAGATTATGALVFGIGTRANNALAGATVLTVDSYGEFTTVYKGKAMATSFIDSGTNSLAFNDSAIPQCRSRATAGFYCPTSALQLSAQNQGKNGQTSTVAFEVGNTDMLFANAGDTAFANLASTGIDGQSFDWGLPFFFGRRVFVALEGATTPGGAGPYFAY